jgi:GNAT superfamily N-acetyltransferase
LSVANVRPESTSQTMPRLTVDAANIDVRLATLDDLPGIAEVALANDPEVAGGGADAGYAAMLLVHGRLVVATSGDRVVGFGATLLIDGNGGPVDHLADLFVHPQWHGRGVGRAVLEAVWSGAAERSTFSSSHPSALPLYVRAGLRPLWPLVYVEGQASDLPERGRRLNVVDVSVEEAADVERAWGGGDRTVTYAYFLARPSSRLVEVRDGGRVLGVAALRTVGDDLKVSHLRAIDAQSQPDVLQSVLGLSGGVAQVAVPGPNAVLQTLLSCGWRVIDVDQYLATADGLLDPSLMFPHPGLA